MAVTFRTVLVVLALKVANARLLSASPATLSPMIPLEVNWASPRPLKTTQPAMSNRQPRLKVMNVAASSWWNITLPSPRNTTGTSSELNVACWFVYSQQMSAPSSLSMTNAPLVKVVAPHPCSPASQPCELATTIRPVYDELLTVDRSLSVPPSTRA